MLTTTRGIIWKIRKEKKKKCAIFIAYKMQVIQRALQETQPLFIVIKRV